VTKKSGRLEEDAPATVFIVDDDPAIRFAMQALVESIQLPGEAFATAAEFLDNVTASRPGCLVLDIRLPGMGGLELQQEMAGRGFSLPIIFITGHGDVQMAVEAMQNGAVDFIQKPVRDQDLIDRIHEALSVDKQQRENLRLEEGIQSRIDTLTKREKEVFDLVVTGKPNKVIAFELDASQRTIEIHRARVMKKMNAASLADLVRMQIAIQ